MEPKKDIQNLFDLLLDDERVKECPNPDLIILKDNRSMPLYNEEFVCDNLVIAICRHGKAYCRYDDHEVEYGANEVSIVLPYHKLVAHYTEDDYRVDLIITSHSFFREYIHRSIMHQHSRFHTFPACELSDEQINRLIQIVDMLQFLSESDIRNRHDLLMYTLDIFFNVYENYCSHSITRNSNTHLQDSFFNSKISKNNYLFNRFNELLSKNYTKSREVTYYADLLCLTPKYFSKVIHQVTGVSAGDWITEYVILQAQQILRTRTDLNIQAISLLLGFEDQATFSRYFKRATGISPREYRELYIQKK